MAGYDDAEPLLSDAEVWRIRERLMLKYPSLPDDTTLITAVLRPPFKTQSGRVEDKEAYFQFIVSAPHPRPVQRRKGIQHAITTTGLLSDWEAKRREREHFVAGEDESAFRIFDATAKTFLDQYQSLQSIIN